MSTFTSYIPMIVNNHSTMKDVSAQNIDISENIIVNGLGTFGSLNSGPTTLETLGVTGNLDVSGESILTGKVVIGDNSLSEPLKVLGDVNVTGNINVDGSFNFKEMIQTTINNTIVISTQTDISNAGTGPALKVSQWGDGDGQHVVLFNAGTEGDALKIDSSGNSHLYKDVDINKNLDVSGNLDVIGNVTINSTLGIRASASNQSFSHIPVFSNNPTSTPQPLVTRTPDELLSDIGAVSSTLNQTISGDKIFTGDTSGCGIIPIGGIILWNTSSPPHGWVICDGTSVSGYGTVPDLRGKFVIGYNEDDARFRPVGMSGGNFKINIENLPNHNHNIATQSGGKHGHNTNDGGSHTHTIGDQSFDIYLELSKDFDGSTEYDGTSREEATHPGGGNDASAYTASLGAIIYQSYANHTHTMSGGSEHTHTVNVSSVGDGDDYIQPYYVLVYIIRVI